jgi:hypothetical protein
MVRPKKGESEKRRMEKHKQWKEKIRARLKPQIQINENKLIQPLLRQGKALTFSQLLEKSGLSRRAFNNRLHGLMEKGVIFKIKGKGKRSLYWLELRVIPNTARFQVRATTILHQSIANDPIDMFNRRLGSLVTYVLKQYELPQAMVSLSPIISQVFAYINLPKTFLGESVLVLEPSVEKSVDWQTWKDLDSCDSSDEK